MPECDFPGCERKEALPFTCSYCGGSFCSKHRLPENHDCKNLHLGKSPSLITEKNVVRPKLSEKEIVTYDFQDDDDSMPYFVDDDEGQVYSMKPRSKQTYDRQFLSRIADSFSTGYEILDIIIGTLAVILSFGFTAIFMSGQPWKYSGFIILIIITIYLSNIIPQKLLAKRFGCTSRYVLTWIGLILTLITTISPIKYLSPGVLLIPELDFIAKKRSGLISAIGSIINLTIGLPFLFLGIFLPNFTNRMLFLSSAFIASQLTIFSLLPFQFSFGRRIIRWNWIIYTVLSTLTLGIFVTSILFGVLGISIL